MIPLTSTSAVLLPTSPKSLRSSLLPALLPLYRARLRKKLNLRRLRNGTCRAEFANDAPIAVAIGACIFSSLVFPTTYTEDDDGDSVIDSADARFAVMGIISFIPYFNWMSWVFAWLDTGKQRYAVYALVYLAPYLRTNLSLSPEDSWLPIASILLCIFHIQLEVSIKNGDFQALNKFTGTGEELSSVSRKKDDSISEEEETNDHKNLPSAQEESRDEIRRWEISRRPSGNPEDLNEDEEDLSGRKH
ncbi:uncharacterized protein LOC107820761 [Nicotiana tabacum]|uniref:Uncharacterized protein LOC107820761 n=1 Tax=Nicotiana tabacum TaxID=4097 RepID=A0A1S4CNP1_TOBAC|nr:uncharacterized protein LOC104086079 [Nicotiana tomentosiformis]XP_016502589.1 PREDICTED: uncharacterized protein LOC107820761 [Nicotiana tabacum]